MGKPYEKQSEPKREAKYGFNMLKNSFNNFLFDNTDACLGSNFEMSHPSNFLYFKTLAKLLLHKNQMSIIILISTVCASRQPPNQPQVDWGLIAIASKNSFLYEDALPNLV